MALERAGGLYARRLFTGEGTGMHCGKRGARKNTANPLLSHTDELTKIQKLSKACLRFLQSS
jgi:hypothetical protein